MKKLPESELNTDSPNASWPLPRDLPVPVDDGACDHLEGKPLPDLSRPSTANREVNLRDAAQDLTVFFFYPRNAQPHEAIPAEWDQIPGARGCTPHCCAFRDAYSEFKKLDANVFGISTQPTDYQQELVQRIRLPYEILSDHDCKLTDALLLPTFEFNGQRLLKRMAWVCKRGRIIKVFYPVFPSDRNAATVLDWLREENEP